MFVNEARSDWLHCRKEMATRADVQRIALSLPGAEKAAEHFAFGIRRKGKLKGFAWVWMERVAPKKPRVPNPRVLAVRVANLAEKERLLDACRKELFTEPHYEGFPAVLVRLDVVPRAAAPGTLDGRVALPGDVRSPPRRPEAGDATATTKRVALAFTTLRQRRSLKNACISARHSSSRTPDTMSNWWLWPGSSAPRTVETIAPVLGSAAP